MTVSLELSDTVRDRTQTGIIQHLIIGRWRCQRSGGLPDLSQWQGDFEDERPTLVQGN